MWRARVQLGQTHRHLRTEHFAPALESTALVAKVQRLPGLQLAISALQVFQQNAQDTPSTTR